MHDGITQLIVTLEKPNVNAFPYRSSHHHINDVPVFEEVWICDSVCLGVLSSVKMSRLVLM